MFVIANLKSVMNLTEMKSYVDKLGGYQQLIIAPSSSYFHLFENSNCLVASQDITCSNRGTYTGEITGAQLRDMKISYALVGHGERRKHFLEDEEVFIKKIDNALKNDIKVVYFVGEDKKMTVDDIKVVLEQQIAKVFNDINYQDMKNIIVAYEPFWAIGNDNQLDVSLVEDIIRFIKNIIFNYYEENIKVIYGGGLTMSDINVLKGLEVLDGVAISSLALDVNNLNEIINILN